MVGVDQPAPSPDPASLLATALKKSDVLWLLPAGATSGGQPFRFHVDADGVWVLTGDGEQPPGPLDGADRVTVVLRSHDSQAGRVVTAEAAAEQVDLTDPAHDRVLESLARTRLNSLGPAELVERWRSTAVTLHRLDVVAQPFATDDDLVRVPTRR